MTLNKSGERTTVSVAEQSTKLDQSRVEFRYIHAEVIHVLFQYLPLAQNGASDGPVSGQNVSISY